MNFDKMTERLQNILTKAIQFAQERSNSELSTEHILKIMNEDDGIQSLWERLNVDYHTVDVIVNEYLAKLPTVYGDIELNIPAGTQNGTQLRLKEKGVPDIHGGKKGDQIVEIKVEIPKMLSKEEKDLYQKLSKIQHSSSQSVFDKFKKAFK